jgi:hypothetical protein
MKKFTSILSIMAVSAVFSTSALAQQQPDATAIASTEVITPISITKTGDMTFGIFSTDGVLGSILISPAATATATPSSGITITNITTPTAASFKVDGDSDYAYTIGLPTEITLTGETAPNPLTINNFTSSLNSSIEGKLDGGTETIYVGGTLNVPAATVKDVYSNTLDLTVTVNYN